MTPTENEPRDRVRRFVAWTLRHGRLLWIVALLAAVPAGWRTVELYANLRSDLEELLPSDAPSVLALRELRARMPGLQYLGVIVDVGPDAAADRLAAAERLVDDLAVRVRAYPPELVAGVRTGFGAERAFLEKNAPLLVELSDLVTIRERIEERVRWEYAKETGALLDDSEPPPSLDFSDVEQRYAGRVPMGDLVGDRFSSPRLGVSLLLIEAGGFFTSGRRAAALLDRVKADVAALGGAGAYAAGRGMKVGYTGDVAVSAEETSALMTDLTLSSLLVVVAVMLVLLAYYRWLASLAALLAPLVVAAVIAFALASLLGVRELNSNTAFLGSIIIGNGINFGIIQLARYVEERRRGLAVQDALVLSLWGTRTGTLSAALAAGVAYLSLTAMQFRGFRQFGVIGGLGMVLAWAATFVLAPPLIARLDRGRVLGRRPPAVLEGRRRTPMAVLANWVSRRPRAIVVVSLALTVAAVLQARRFGAEQLEYDFSRMRRADTWRTGEGYWGRKMDALLGRYLTPTVLLVDSQDEARRVAAALRDAAKSPPLSDMVASIRTEEDVLPRDQDARRAEIERIRKKLTPVVRASLDPELDRKLDRLLGAGPVAPITAADVPDTLLKGMRERDGTSARAVLVNPKPIALLWKGPKNAAFVAALRTVARLPEATGGQAARVAGTPALTADIIASMNRDGPLASMLAFVGVMLTVVLLFRLGIATPFVVGSLVIGVVWQLALTMALGIKINFINFIAFPITFGIGVDYAVNVVARFLRDGGRDAAAAIRGTGGAVGLCSLTTILGYSSLLVAENRGLFHFGFLAVLGEIACLTTAVVVLPAALLLVRKRPGVPSPAPGSESLSPAE